LGGQLEVDKSYVVTDSVLYDAVFIAGGKDNVATLKNQGGALHFVNEVFKHGKAIGAMGMTVELLQKAPLPVPATGVVTVDEGREFAQAFINAIAQQRHWDRPQKDQVPA
jgi:catalase